MKDEMEMACGTRAFAPVAGGVEYGTLMLAPSAGRYLHTSVSRASAYSGRLTSRPSFR